MTSFNFQCFPSATTNIIALIVIAISLCGMLIFGSMSCHKLQQMEKLNKFMKGLFYFTFIASCLAEICHGWAQILCAVHVDNIDIVIMRGIHIMVYMSVLMGLLLTLIARLHFTFKDSIYKISNFHQVLLILLLVVAQIMGTLYSIGLFLTRQSQTIAAIGASIIYTVTTIYSVSLFARSLMKLVDARATSVRNVMDGNAIKLNKSQTKFIAQTSKYITLLGLATLSSILTIIGLGVATITNWTWIGYLLGIHISIDTFINLMLLCLQYPFANHYYNKLCKCADRFWTFLLMTKAEREMQIKYQESIKMYQSQSQSNQLQDNEKIEIEDV